MFKRILIAILEPWTSRRLWMTILAVIVMQQLFWTATWYLYSFREEWMAKYFVQMFFATQGTIATVMLGWLGFSNIKSNAASLISSIFTKKEKDIQTE